LRSAATVAAVIAGVADGSAAGTWIGARTKNHLAWLMVAFIELRSRTA
jgi:hypothetical protein